MKPGLRLTFGDPSDGYIAFGPVAPKRDEKADLQGSFLECPVVLHRDGFEDIELTRRNGVEPLALARLRDGLNLLMTNRTGTLFFGDHDYSAMVTLKGGGDGWVRLWAELPLPDFLPVELAPLPIAALTALVEAVDQIEDEVGPLVGHCYCGEPSLSYYN